MKRSSLNISIKDLEIKDGKIHAVLECLPLSLESISFEIKRITFLDFLDVQSIPPESFKKFYTIEGSEVLIPVAFELSDEFIDKQQGTITVDAYDLSVHHSVTYTFDIQSLNDVTLKEFYEVNEHEKIEDDPTDQIMGLINQLKHNFKGHVIVKEMQQDEVEDMMAKKKKDKIIN